MPRVTDQMGRTVDVPDTPSRIVSLVPSQTELLYDLGLEEEVLGITEYCVHPEHWLQEKSIVGGTKNTKLKQVEQLEPDLIIGNKEENTKRKIEKLEKKHPVWMSDVQDVPDALWMIRELGRITGKGEKAEELASRIEAGFEGLKKESRDRKRIPTAYFIWKDPWMVAASGSFIDAVLHITGHRNVFQPPFPDRIQTSIDAGKASEQYPSIELEELESLNPERILLSSEPYSFEERHRQEMVERFPVAEVKLVDGEMFSWYGSRLEKATDYLMAFTKSTIRGITTSGAS